MIRINYEIKVSPEERKGDTPLTFWIERPTLYSKSLQLQTRTFNQAQISTKISYPTKLSHADSEDKIPVTKL